MRTFLSKIRRSLIESGSAGKYLLYAIGEVALVVIGILIALQVNNWNSYNVEVKSLTGSLGYVLEDIDNNREQLEKLQQQRASALTSCSEIIDLYRQSSPIPLSSFMEGYVPVVVEQRFKMSTSGVERLKSSELFESEPLVRIRALVREYEELFEENRYTESKLNGHIEAMETELFSNGFYDGIWGFLRAAVIDEGRFERPLEDSDMNPRMNQYGPLVGIFLRYEIEAPIIIREYGAILIKGEELRAEITSHLGG